jgi:hypothetical protein
LWILAQFQGFCSDTIIADLPQRREICGVFDHSFGLYTPINATREVSPAINEVISYLQSMA